MENPAVLDLVTTIANQVVVMNNATTLATTSTTVAAASSAATSPVSSIILECSAPMNTATAAVAHNENILVMIQSQIAALESQLKSTQERLRESELQCHSLKMAVQSQPVTTSTAAASTIAVPQIDIQPMPNIVQQRRSPYNSIYTQPATSMPSTYATMPPASNGYLNSNVADTIFARTSNNNVHTPSSIYAAMPPASNGYSNVVNLGFARTSYNNVHSSSSIYNAMPQQSAVNSAYSPYAMISRKVQDLPVFSGQSEDWPVFFTAFAQTTAAYNYTNLENNQRLQKALTGEARETVKSLLIHPDNVDAIIDQLRFRFGRPEQLIRSQLNQVREIMPISENTVTRLIPFATKVKNLSVFLQSVNSQQHMSNPTLLEELVSKLPMSKRLEWARYSTQVQPYPTIVNFSDWLSDTANLICMVQDSDNREQKRRMPILHAAGKYRLPVPKCSICNGQHKVTECKRFIDLAISQRWSKAKQDRLCFTCLKPGHATRDCYSKRTCSINGCQRRHHELLHEVPIMHSAQQQRHPRGKLAEEPVSSTSVSTLLATQDAVRNNSHLFRVLPVTLYGPNKTIDTFALLDEGSSISMLDADLAKELGLYGRHRSLNMQWVGGRQVQESTVLVDVYVSGAGKKKKHMLRDVYGVSNLNLPVQSLCEGELRNLNNSHGRLKLQPYSNAEPKLLIGLDHCHLGLPKNFKVINKNGPYAANTELGWVVFGPTTKTAATTPSCLLTCTPSNDSLHKLVEEYFETENFGVKPSHPIESKADARARDILQSTTKRINARFQTGLLWRIDEVELPDSYSMAMKRLVGIERKMKRDENFAAAYSSIVESYINKNYARKLQPAEAAIVGPKTWYLPHFGVVNPNKAKIRLVFDAAAEVQGISLNSYLLKGPQEYQSLPSVLYHFREGAVAVCGDIKEMFHQILIQPEDRCAQRFLWRDGDDSKPPDVFEMVVMTFGASCSPCAAQYVKTTNAMEHQDHHPRALKAIMDHHYVDDFVDSFESTEQAIEISQQVKEIHKDAGFELRNFTSNVPEVRDALQGNDFDIIVSSKGSLETEKILGMFWQPATDNFMYQLKFHHVDEHVINGMRSPTKRELLSVIMSIFDPLGFLSHFTIAAKLLMREVWRHDIRWDECLPEGILMGWNRWRSKLLDVVKFKVPRFYFRNGSPQEVQLHIFVDASEDAFAAVAYWRAVNPNGEVDTSFVCAKTKCAPLKPLTIPRIELQAAVLGVRLMTTIIEQHSVSISRTILWSDSTTVIKWIGSEHRRYKPFVAHRIAEILATSNLSNWRWVPTYENPADEATRASSHLDFSASSRWLRGPNFLLTKEHEWPVIVTANINAREDDEELRPKYALTIVSKTIIDFNRFSSLNRLVRTMAWVLRFLDGCRKRFRNSTGNSLTACELEAAERLLCRQAQLEAFSAEMNQINRNENLKKGSALHKLSPYIDSDGILRVHGRIDAASWLTYAAKRPIILPPVHRFTTLVVADKHRRMKHQNSEATICEIRHKYWVPRLRQIIRKIIADCPECRISRVKPVTPMMGPLPEDRLRPFVRPFSYTGLDFFGPLTVSIGRRTEKRWVALFTCLTVRAIHLETVHDLSTDACIVAIRNFINRRGVPVKIRSDNGTNFVGANQEAKRFSEVFDCDRVQDELAAKGVKWVFNCPANPSEGGVWERMVRCVKRVLLHTLKEVSPQEYTLQCLVIEAENVVNSRPLTHLPIEPDQEEPLTPNHFLLGSANTAQTPSVTESPKKLCQLRKQWRIARQLRDRFWKRWVSEYLPTLTRRAKWCQRSRPITKGDLVFVCDVNMPRRQWCRGRIEEVYTGVDGQVRSADVRTTKGLMRRPASKLAVLDLNFSESESIHGEGGVAERPA